MSLLPFQASLPCLTHLELGDNFYPEDNHDQERIDVRNRIFSKLPSLQILDGDDVNGKPEEENDEQDDEDEDDDDEDDEDEDEEHGIMNGLRDDVIDGDDEFEEDDDAEEEEDEYEGGFGSERNHYNGDINGTLQDYNDQSSDAEDEQDDDDDDEDDDDLVNHPPVRGKKRKFDDEGIPQLSM